MGVAEYLKGSTDALTLTGEAPTQALANLRNLRDLELLTDSMVWELLAQSDVDPWYFIRLIRKHKAELGFHNKEHHVGDTLYFLSGDCRDGKYAVVYGVNIFTNNVTVLFRDSDMTRSYNAKDVMEALVKSPVGEERLKAFLDAVKQHTALPTGQPTK